jgi:hypothetical protein
MASLKPATVSLTPHTHLFLLIPYTLHIMCDDFVSMAASWPWTQWYRLRVPNTIPFAVATFWR